MNRYALLAEGVLDRTIGRRIMPVDAEWSDYLAHRRAGGDVDPMEPEVEPVERRRARALARLADPAGRSERRPYTIAAGTFALDRTAQQMVLAAVALDATLTGSVPSPFVLYDVAGVAVTLGPAQRRNLAERVLARMHRLYVRRRELEAAIAATSDPESVDAEAGWEE